MFLTARARTQNHDQDQELRWRVYTRSGGGHPDRIPGVRTPARWSTPPPIAQSLEAPQRKTTGTGGTRKASSEAPTALVRKHTLSRFP